MTHTFVLQVLVWLGNSASLKRHLLKTRSPPLLLITLGWGTYNSHLNHQFLLAGDAPNYWRLVPLLILPVR